MPKYLIGIDVGGTNTDSVLLEPANDNVSVVSWNKQLTSPNVSKGIKDSIEQLFSSADHDKNNVLSVTIGTTHFINAIVERDRARLEKVAVLRICGPYSHTIPPFSNFPTDLKTLLEGYTGFLSGGFHVDGNEIALVDEQQVRAEAKKIKSLGMTAVAVSGVFSPVFPDQEERVAAILAEELPESTIIVTSHGLSGIGILERENIAILNASVKKFANNIIRTFSDAVKSTGINAPILLTQNDGTVLTISEALSTPIKTFSSGTTNSMRGAAFLVNGSSGANLAGQSVIVVDVGGTTTDVGLLLDNGYPRKTSAFSFIGGVKTRLAMPQVESIGLGGGSIVRFDGEDVTIGPDSVGNDFSKSIVGGGKTLTTSDIAVFMELEGDKRMDKPIYAVGDKELVRGQVEAAMIPAYRAKVSEMIEAVVDRMKTSPDDIPVLLVGGGSFILPDDIKGASKVWRPEYFQVANAIGAAIGKISASAQAFGKADEKEELVEKLRAEAEEKAIKLGAQADSITVVDITSEELPYVNMHKYEVKVVADMDYSKLETIEHDDISNLADGVDGSISKDSLGRQDGEDVVDYETYKPTVVNREWVLSETDLEFLRVGTYILGCGGGGDPYPQYLIARNLVRQGTIITVIDPQDLKDTNQSIFAGFVGTPTVASERIQGAELQTAYNLLNPGDIETIVSLEIGGGNGFQGLLLGAELGKKVIDCDLMGRAYPMIWQITPCVMSDDPCYSPCAFSDGNGNDVLVKKTKTNKAAESLIRAALSELGMFVGLVSVIDDIQGMAIKNSISLAWRIGKAVSIAKQHSNISNVAQYIIDSVKPTSAKLLFEGKIVGVEKRLQKGYVFGEVVIESLNKGTMRIPFQNENLVAKVDDKVVASVPDLICVLDSETGEAVGTPDYKYGLVVCVIAIAPSDHWTSERGLEVGGPSAFGFNDVVYESVGTYAKTVGVIEEFK